MLVGKAVKLSAVAFWISLTGTLQLQSQCTIITACNYVRNYFWEQNKFSETSLRYRNTLPQGYLLQLNLDCCMICLFFKIRYYFIYPEGSCWRVRATFVVVNLLQGLLYSLFSFLVSSKRHSNRVNNVWAGPSLMSLKWELLLISFTSWPDFTPGGCSSTGGLASHLRLKVKKSCQSQLKQTARSLE